jgi:hypothetical protein
MLFLQTIFYMLHTHYVITTHISIIGGKSQSDKHVLSVKTESHYENLVEPCSQYRHGTSTLNISPWHQTWLLCNLLHITSATNYWRVTDDLGKSAQWQFYSSHHINIYFIRGQSSIYTEYLQNVLGVSLCYIFYKHETQLSETMNWQLTGSYSLLHTNIFLPGIQLNQLIN